LIVDGSSASGTYTPDLNYNGPDIVEYEIRDGRGQSSRGVIRIIVRPINDTPLLSAANVTVAEDSSVTIRLTASDVDGDPITFSLGTPAHGTLGPLTHPSPRSVEVTYRPAADYSGPDGFSCSASDGRLISTSRITINVTAQPDTPLASADSYATLEDNPFCRRARRSIQRQRSGGRAAHGNRDHASRLRNCHLECQRVIPLLAECELQRERLVRLHGQ
jgi:hypothetical protein